MVDGRELVGKTGNFSIEGSVGAVSGSGVSERPSSLKLFSRGMNCLKISQGAEHLHYKKAYLKSLSGDDRSYYYNMRKNSHA